MDVNDTRSSLMLDSAPMAVNFFDSSFNATDCNMEAVRMFGFHEKADYLHNFLYLMPPVQPNGRSSKELICEYLAEAFEQGYSKHEFVRQRIDGSLMYTEASFVRAEYNGTHVVTAYFRDLSDIYEAMEREREAHETMQLFMDASPVGMELWDETGEISDCNRQIVEMFGFSDKNSFLSRVKDAWAGEHLSPDYFHAALSDGFARYEWDFYRADGKIMHCEVRLVRTMRHNRSQVMAYFLDISDVKKAIDAAREADKRAMLMLDATPLACFLVLETMNAIDCNLAAVELFGFADKEEAITRYREIFPTVSPEGKPLRIPSSLEWVNTSEEISFEYDHLSISTGEYIPCDVTMVYLDYQNHPVMACYYRDLRAIKAMIAEMKRIEVAEEESRAKSQFLARMSHEIRTPLNAIMGVCDIQLQKHGHSPETEEAFMQVRSSSNILLSIINDILDLSKVEAGKMEIFNKPYDVAGLIFDTVQLNLMHLGSKRIKFNLIVDENLPTLLVGDELRIKQVLNNLLSNAFKYTLVGEVNLHFKLEMDSPSTASLLIELSDTGQGMTETQLASLFESEYVRFNVASNRLIQGTGLGMNIANRLISLMQGTISAKSEVGTGSTFYVKLPQKIGSKKCLGKSISKNLQNFRLSQRAFRARHSFEYKYMPYGKVLVVDDVDSNLFVAKGLLMPYGLTVHTAASGYDCIDKIKTGEVYDIVFMDHMMPEIDGIETAKKMREMGYDQPIVALTANTILGQAELFVAHGFAGFISKPIDVARLNSYLMSLIHDKQRPDVLAAAEEAKKIAEKPVDISAGMAEAFARDAEHTLKALEPLMERTDWSDDDYRIFTIRTHGIKSALANIGRTRLADVAGSLELAGRDRADEMIRREAPIFLDDLCRFLEKVSHNGGEEIATDAEENTVLLHETLGEIKDACESYNKKEIRAALKKLTAQAWASETDALFGEITVNLLHSEFEKISDDIANFLENATQNGSEKFLVNATQNGSENFLVNDTQNGSENFLVNATQDGSEEFLKGAAPCA